VPTRLEDCEVVILSKSPRVAITPKVAIITEGSNLDLVNTYI